MVESIHFLPCNCHDITNLEALPINDNRSTRRPSSQYLSKLFPLFYTNIAKLTRHAVCCMILLLDVEITGDNAASIVDHANPPSFMSGRGGKPLGFPTLYMEYLAVFELLSSFHFFHCLEDRLTIVIAKFAPRFVLHLSSSSS